MTDLNPALVGQQQQSSNLDWPSSNAHNRGRLSSSAEKTPIGFLPSKSGQPGHLRPPNHREVQPNGVVEPNERPTRPPSSDFVVPPTDESAFAQSADQHIPPTATSPMMPSPQMGSPIPTRQMGNMNLDSPNPSLREQKSDTNVSNGVSDANAVNPNGSDGNTNNTNGANSSSSKLNRNASSASPKSSAIKLSAHAPVFQPSQKKDGSSGWGDFTSSSKSGRGGRHASGDTTGQDGGGGSGVHSRGGVSGTGGGVATATSGGTNRHVSKMADDRTLQKLNLLYPNGPTQETTAYLASRGPKAARYEYLSSATTWLPGQYHVFDWKGFVYTLAQPIHMGMNGHIHHCARQQRLPTGEMAARKKNVAAKVVPNTPAFEREIIILRALQQDCNNIIKLRDVIEQPTCLISIMELAQTDVHQFFAGRSAKQHGWRLDKTATREYFARMVVNDVVHGLKQMHERRYLHCDLKAQNILMFIWRSSRKGGSYVQAKLTDFGHSWKGQVRMAERLFPNGMARVGTAGHVAPELFVEGSACGPKIDIWSLGVVMFSMLVPGHLPFGEYSNLANLRKVYDIVNDPEVPFSENSSWMVLFNSCSPEARDLILWMTRLDPAERPDEDAILAHPWFHISSGIKDTSGYRGKLQYWSSMSHFSRAYE